MSSPDSGLWLHSPPAGSRGLGEEAESIPEQEETNGLKTNRNDYVRPIPCLVRAGFSFDF